MQSGKTPGPVSNVQLNFLIGAGYVPDLFDPLQVMMGVTLDPRKMSDIQVGFFKNPTTDETLWNYRFVYEPHWSVKIAAYASEHDASSLSDISTIKVVHTHTAESRTFRQLNNWAPVDPFDWAPKEQEKDLYRKGQDSTQGRRGRAPATHRISFNYVLGSVRCSCLANDEHVWCKTIMDYVNKCTDVTLVKDIMNGFGKEPRSYGDEMIVKLPVMPRAVLPITIRRAVASESEESETVYDFRLEVHEDIRIWWQRGDGFKPVVSEMFAYLHASKLLADWRTLTAAVAKNPPVSGATNVLMHACPHKYHNKSRHKLFETMVTERLDPGNPQDENKNLQYLAMLNAFYCMIYGKCYACHVSFNPEKDVPRI